MSGRSSQQPGLALGGGDRTVLGGFGIAIVMVGFGYVGGLPGVGVAFGVGVLWALGGVPFAIGAATIGLVALGPVANPWILWASLLGGLLLAAVDTYKGAPARGRTLVVFVAGVLGFGLLAIGTVRATDSVLLGGGVLLLSVALAIYGVHRVGVVRQETSDRVGIVSDRFGVADGGSSRGSAGGSIGDLDE